MNKIEQTDFPPIRHHLHLRQALMGIFLIGMLLLGACHLKLSSTDLLAPTATPASLALVRATAPSAVLPAAANDQASHAVAPTLAPAATLTTTATITPTSTVPIVEVYTVVAGDTLSKLAADFGTSVAALKSANHLTSDLILVGQQLRIPAAASTPAGQAVVEAVTDPAEDEQGPPASTATPLVIRPSPLIGAPLIGALDSAYPAALPLERFTLHYTPGVADAHPPQRLAEQVAAALVHHEQLLAVHLAGHFDVYAAGAPFAAPDQALRGRSFSAQRRFFFLADGTGTPTDQQYIIAHELTHVFTWNTFGAPASVMLHEGVAVYAGMEMVADGEFLPLEQFCVAYLQAGALPRVTSNLRFMGHIRDLENYYAAGCFVGFLIERYGAENLGVSIPAAPMRPSMAKPCSNSKANG